MTQMRKRSKSVDSQTEASLPGESAVRMLEESKIGIVGANRPGLDVPALDGNERDNSALTSEFFSAGQRSWVLDRKMLLSFGGMEEFHATEEFRSIRNQLYRRREERDLKSLLIASAVPKEGRSFVAVNLAQVLALQADCRVLLIDGDLRNPGLHEAFGTSRHPGLSEYLVRECDELDGIQAGSIENLFFLPSGGPTASPSELAASGRLKTLLKNVRSLFDWVIVDSSPAAVLDPSLFAHQCDGVLMVVRANSTPFDVARKARMKFGSESVVGVVLNRIVERVPVQNQQAQNREEPAREIARVQELLAEE